ncbi:MAG TPA: antitoxin VapB family protein [Candidatus Nanoarchaeia archaeon]|nr:antitoxin VapB family protein [Candidatus Nanoarchaeia archaeon]
MVKTITVMDDAYEMLKRMKNKDESFSDVIRKCVSCRSTDLKKWLGILGKDESRTKEFKEFLTKTRKETSKDIETRIFKLKR